MKKKFSNFSGWKLPTLALFALGFALASVLFRPSAPAQEIYAAPPQTPYSQTVAGIGLVEPKNEIISISAQKSGIVRYVWVKAGDEVQKGDPLFSLDQRDIDAVIEVLQASLNSAQVQEQDAQAEFDIFNQLKSSRAITKDEYDRKRFAVLLAQARTQEIQAQLHQAQITKEQMTTNAPNDGRILHVNVRPGEYALSGPSENPLIRLGDISELHVRVEFDEENIPRIHTNALAQAYVRAADAKPYVLHFIRSEPLVKPKMNLITGARVDTRVLEVIYALPLNTQDVYIGQKMDVFVEAKSP